MKRILRTRKMWALALGVALAPAVAFAQQAPQATAAGQQQPPSSVDRYVPGQAIPELPPGSTMLPMTLEQAMDRALEKNLSLKAARLNPQSVDYQLASARAAFSPQLTGLYSYRDAASPNNNRLEERLTVNTIGQNFNVGMSQTTPWYGGRLTAAFNNSRSASNSSQAQRNPAFNAGLQFNYTQPLLAGFRIDSNRNQLRTLSVQRQIADIQLLTTIENTKASVRTAYWNLRQAIEQIEIQRRSLALAQRLYEENRTKVEIGTLAPIETTTSEAQVANAEQALLNAQIQWRTAELAIKQLLADSPQDELYNQTINPIETPPEVVTEVDIPAAVRRALAERTDLTQSRRNLEVSQMSLSLVGDQTKPQLDLSGGYGLSGQGGPLFANGVITTPGGWGQALSALSGFDVPTWNFQFNFTYPLFMRAAKANYARAQLQMQQSIAQLQAQELQVSTLVTNAGLAVENSYKQFQAARKAREVAERNADAEQTRFDVGMSTNYNVVQAQNNLTSQRLTELRAIISYLNAIAEFERVQRFGNTGGGN